MRYFVLVIMFFVTLLGWSQELPFQFKGRISNMDNGGYEGGVTIAVVQNGSTVISTQSSSNGKYNLIGNVNYTMPFQVVYSKPGLVSKMISFNFSKMNEEDVPPGNIRPAEDLSTSLFAERENIDFDFLKTEPVLKVSWDTRALGPKFDNAQAAAMKKKIADLLRSAENQEKAIEEKYQKAISEADAAYGKENWEEALTKYEEALTIKPNEKYPSDKIVELDALIKAQKDKELAEQQEQAEYDNLISAADNLRDQSQLDAAVSKYKEASQKKPTEQYPKDQITDLEARIEQLKKEEEAQAAYDAAIKSADAAFSSEDYETAKSKYEEASTVKPLEQYPKDKLAVIAQKQKEAEELAEQKRKYDEAIAGADAAFNSEDYETAKSKYEQAIPFADDASYANGRIETCKEKLADAMAEQAKQEQIQNLLAQGQAAIDAKSYIEAIAKYDEVLGLESDNAEAKEKKALAEQLKSEQEQQAEADKQFNDLVAQGDNAVGAQNFEEAITKYEEALKIKSNSGVDSKLADAKAKLKEQQDLAAKNEQFRVLIEEGNDLLAKGELESAKAKFVEAKGLDASSDIPPAKIKEIDQLLADKEAESERQANYDKAIKEADDLFAGEKWEDAKSKYEQAITFTDDPSYAKGKLAEIADKISSELAEKEKQEQIQNLLAQGQAAIDAKSYIEAIAKYDEVLGLESEHAEAKEKKALAEKLKAEQEQQAEADKQFNDLVSEGDNAVGAQNFEEAISKYEEALNIKSDSGVDSKLADARAKLKEQQDLAAQNEQFQTLIEEGNDLLAKGELESAKAKFVEAKRIDASSDIPPAKIKEIDDMLADQQASAEHQANYDKAIKEADNLFGNEDWEQAKAKYEEAITYTDDASYANGKLDEIAEKISSELAEKEKQEQIEKLLSEGESLYASNSLEDARSKYEEVLTLDSDNQTAKNQIDQINNDLAAQKGEAEKQEAFDKLKQEGFDLADNGDYDQAKSKLKEALALIPDSEVESKIAEIEGIQQEKEEVAGLIADGNKFFGEDKFEAAKAKFESALAKDPGNSDAQEGLDKTNQAIEDQQALALEEERFAKLKEDGLKYKGEQKYDDAKAKLNEALEIKDDADIRNALEDIRLAEEALLADASNNEKYKGLMDAGENLVSVGSYDEAIEKFEEAKKIKPSESEPDEKIAAAKQKLKELADQEKIDKEYNDLIEKGDQLVADEDYVEAIKAFNEALALKPTESLPVQKAKEAEELAKNSKSDADKAVEKNLSIAEKKIEEGNYDRAEEILTSTENLGPGPDRIAEINELRDRIKTYKKRDDDYDKALATGKKKYDQKEYDDALEAYREANRLKSEEQLPKDKIAELEGLLNDEEALAQKEKLYQEYMDKGASNLKDKKYDLALTAYQNALKAKEGDKPAKDKIDEVQQILDDLANKSEEEVALRNKFDEIVSEANVLFNAESYLDAKTKYEEALKMFPNDGYVKQRIEQCIKREKDLSDKLEDQQYQKLLEAADKNFEEEDYDKAKERYNNAVSLRSNDPYPKKKLAEIEAILNPASTNSAELIDPGVKIDGSILDGQALLQQAQDERDALEKQKLKSKIDKHDIEMSAIATEKNLDREKSRQEIVDVYESVGEYSEEANMQHNENADIIHKKEIEIEDAFSEDGMYDYKANVNDQVQLNNITDGVALNYGERSEVYMDNAGTVDAYEKALAEAFEAQANSDYGSSIVSDQKLIEAKKTVQSEVIDDFEDRDKVRAQVDEVAQGIAKANREMDQADYESNHEARGVVEKVYIDVDTKTTEDTQIARDNNSSLVVIHDEVNAASDDLGSSETIDNYEAEAAINNVVINYQSKTEEGVEQIKKNGIELREISTDISNADLAMNEEETKFAYDADRQVTGYKEKSQADMSGMDDNRKEGVEVLKGTQNEINESEMDMNATETDFAYGADRQMEAHKKKTQADMSGMDDNRKEGVEVLKGTQNDINASEMGMNASETEFAYGADRQMEAHKEKTQADLSGMDENRKEGVEVLKGTQNEINESEMDMNSSETDFAYGADRQMTGYKKKTQADMSVMDENRKESVETIRKGNKELAEANDGLSEGNKEKALSNQGAIDEETKTNGEIQEKADEKLSENVAGVKGIGKKAHDSYSAEIRGDKEERLGSQQGIANAYIKKSEDSELGTEKQKENSETLSNAKEVIDAESGSRADSKQDDIYGSANAISKVDNSPGEKPVIANSLGEEYPEGVTEESFAENDQNGLMRAIITRRIVVINGHADVYKRTQSLGAITYSKNGKPITEHVWNSETSGPNLVRHTK